MLSYIFTKLFNVILFLFTKIIKNDKYEKNIFAKIPMPVYGDLR